MINRKFAWLVPCVALIGGWCVTIARAQEPRSTSKLTEAEVKASATGERTETGRTQHSVYLPKHTAASQLAILLSKQFGGDASVKAAAEADANVLFIRATSPAGLENVRKALSQIDKPVRQAAFQVLIVELNANKSDGSEKDESKPAVDVGQLTGSADAVLAVVAKWEAAGHVASVQRYSVTSLENHVCHLNVGELAPRITASSPSTPNRSVVPQVVQEHVGATIELQPRITESREIITTCGLETSRFETKGRVTETAQKENGSIDTQVRVASLMQTTLTIPDGQSRVASEWQAKLPSNHAPSIVVISARVVDVKNSRRPDVNAPMTPATTANHPAGRSSGIPTGPEAGRPMSRPTEKSGPETSAVSPPKLLVPEEKAVLPNSAAQGRTGRVVMFDWEDVPQATLYELHVQHATAMRPVIHEAALKESSFTWSSKSYVLNENLVGWTWRVRAKVDGKWTKWSERPFSYTRLKND